jgi:hypothetical protein
MTLKKNSSFEVYSSFGRKKAIFSFFFCLVILFFCLLKYYYNSTFFFIVILLTICMAWISGYYDGIVLYENRIEIVNRHLVPIFSRVKIVKFETIKEINFKNTYYKRDFYRNQIMSLILPGFSIINNSMEFFFNNGEKKVFTSQIQGEGLLSATKFLPKHVIYCTSRPAIRSVPNQ